MTGVLCSIKLQQPCCYYCIKHNAFCICTHIIELCLCVCVSLNPLSISPCQSPHCRRRRDATGRRRRVAAADAAIAVVVVRSATDWTRGAAHLVVAVEVEVSLSSCRPSWWAALWVRDRALPKSRSTRLRALQSWAMEQCRVRRLLRGRVLVGILQCVNFKLLLFLYIYSILYKLTNIF